MEEVLVKEKSVFKTSPVLQAHAVSKYFYEPHPFQVLKEVSFSVNRGEFLSLVGKSGSGKSTLLYILSTMDTNYEGELTIRGEKLTGRNSDYLSSFRNAHIGFVFQFHYLLPEFTCLQNVMLPAFKLGGLHRAEIREKAYEKLKLLGVS
jgi:lipoprotein-releasing system ATP-binding protein